MLQHLRGATAGTPVSSPTPSVVTTAPAPEHCSIRLRPHRATHKSPQRRHRRQAPTPAQTVAAQCSSWPSSCRNRPLEPRLKREPHEPANLINPNPSMPRLPAIGHLQPAAPRMADSRTRSIEVAARNHRIERPDPFSAPRSRSPSADTARAFIHREDRIPIGSAYTAPYRIASAVSSLEACPSPAPKRNQRSCLTACAGDRQP
jgi:hypothetical protein